MKKYFLIIFIILLSGCAANSGNMTPILQQDNIVKENNKYYHNIGNIEVRGGSKTNPLWMSEISDEDFKTALTTTLTAHNFWNKDGTYSVTATLEKIDKPLIGITMDVTATIHYNIIDKNKNVIFDKKIVSIGTAGFSDAIIGPMRLQIANERVARENIKKFIEDLNAQ